MPVVAPTFFGSVDVALLRSLGSAAEQDDQRVPVETEVDPESGAAVDPAFPHPISDVSMVAETPGFHASDSSGDLGRRLRVETIEPATEWASATSIDVFL